MWDPALGGRPDAGIAGGLLAQARAIDNRVNNAGFGFTGLPNDSRGTVAKLSAVFLGDAPALLRN